MTSDPFCCFAPGTELFCSGPHVLVISGWFGLCTSLLKQKLITIIKAMLPLTHRVIMMSLKDSALC